MPSGFGGLVPRIGNSAWANMPLPSETVRSPALVSTCTHWPFASPLRLSPASPGSGLGASSNTLPFAGKFGSDTRSFDHAWSTSLSQPDAARTCS